MSKIPHIVQNYCFFSKRHTGPLKGDMLGCTLHCFKGRGASSKGMLHFVHVYCSFKKHCIAPKEDYIHLLRTVCRISVLHTACVGRYGNIVITVCRRHLAASSIFCRNCV